jgi:hypothetical protein
MDEERKQILNLLREILENVVTSPQAAIWFAKKP